MTAHYVGGRGDSIYLLIFSIGINVMNIIKSIDVGIGEYVINNYLLSLTLIFLNNK